MSTSPGLLERLSVGGTANPRLICAATLALVFLCGGVAGALVMDLRVHNRPRPANFAASQGQTPYFERLQKELDLDATQSEQVKSILGDFWQYYRTVLSECRGRIEQVLTPAQQVKFEKLLQEQGK